MGVCVWWQLKNWSVNGGNGGGFKSCQFCVPEHYMRGTLGGSEHRNTAEKFAKYSNIAK